MNVNIYLEDSLGKCLNQQAKKIGKSRNAIVREAIKEWMEHHGTKRWPNSILTFTGIEGVVPFESYRTDLLPPEEDPLA